MLLSDAFLLEQLDYLRTLALPAGSLSNAAAVMLKASWQHCPKESGSTGWKGRNASLAELLQVSTPVWHSLYGHDRHNVMKLQSKKR